MNRVILAGRLETEPEITLSKDGKFRFFNFQIAVKCEESSGVDFFNCTAYGDVAQQIYEYSKKHDVINLIGYIKNYSFNKQIGNYSVRQTATRIIVKTFEVLATNQVTFEPISDINDEYFDGDE